jgi:hypothetical protein
MLDWNLPRMTCLRGYAQTAFGCVQMHSKHCRAMMRKRLLR